MKLDQASFTSKGVCGCLFVSLNILNEKLDNYKVKLELEIIFSLFLNPKNFLFLFFFFLFRSKKVGCVAFGQNCEQKNCEDYSYDCAACTVLEHCGFCSKPAQCLPKATNGSPAVGHCRAVNWHDERVTC